MSYDSRQDTEKHIADVRHELEEFSSGLYQRGLKHDLSKLNSQVEKDLFDEMTPILKTLVYGTAEYKDSLAKLKPALDNHYAVNSHHPEHYPEGVDGMNLLDLVEMWCDWKAAVKRTATGDIAKSLEINRVRFKLSDQLYNILKNSI
jgi:hypothetical protein